MATNMETTIMDKQNEKSDKGCGSDSMTCCTVDLVKITELGQAYANFELIRTMATQAQTRYGKHLDLNTVEWMGDIAKDADYVIKRIMAAFDAAK